MQIRNAAAAADTVTRGLTETVCDVANIDGVSSEARVPKTAAFMKIEGATRIVKF